MKTAFSILYFLAGFFFLLFSSCKKNPDEDFTKTGLTVSIQGINEIIPREVTSKSSLRSLNSFGEPKSAMNYLIQEDLKMQDYDLDLIVSETVEKTPLRSTISVVPMDGSHQYLFILYDTKADGQIGSYYGQAKGSVNSLLNIRVYRNRTYKWFAYSFNNSAVIPDFDPNNPQLNILSSESGIGSDLLYTSGELTTSDEAEGNNKVGITFKRMVSTIRIELNTRGAFSSIDYATLDIPGTGTISGLHNGLFSVLGGNFSSSSDAPSFSKNTWTDKVADSIPTGWVKYIDLLTVANGEPIELQATLKNFRIRSYAVNPDAPQNTDYRITRDFASGHIQFPSFTAEAGRRYNLTIRVRESAIDFAGAKWARCNLTYFKNDKGNKYRFWYNSYFVKNISGGMHNFLERDYFDTKPPVGEIQAPARVWDPCDLVYPKGTWRLPTETEFINLISSTNAGNRVRNPQPENKGWYVAWKNAAPEMGAQYAHRDLKFTAAGYRAHNRTLKAFYYKHWDSSNPFNQYGDEGYFRSSDTSEFLVTKYKPHGLDDNVFLAVNEFLDGRGANVRCVRK